MYHFHTAQIYPTAAEKARLFDFLYITRRLYNYFLEQRIKHYRETGEPLTNFTMRADFHILRSMMPSLAECPCDIAGEAIRRLDIAFIAFARRANQKKGKAGFPRFKSSNRWNTLGFPVDPRKPGPIINGKLRVPRLAGKVAGYVRIRGLSNMPQGRVRGVRVVYRAGKWFAHFNIDDGKPFPPKIPVVSSIGIDVGLSKFAALSDGSVIPNPRFGQSLQRRIAHAQRMIQRRQKGSKRRRKAIWKLQRLYLKAVNQRDTFTHTVAKRIVSQHQFIAIEDLNVKGMVRGRFARSILDAAWSKFTSRLGFKAEKAGCQLVKVDPRGTSQDCSGCGRTVQKSLAVRVHKCNDCGLEIDRDVNAAKNILLRASEPRRVYRKRKCRGAAHSAAVSRQGDNCFTDVT